MSDQNNQTRRERLLEISSQINRGNDLGSKMQAIADAAAEITSSEGSSILLFEEETQQLYFAAARAENRDHLMQIRVPIEKSVAGWVFDQGQPLKIANAKIDPLIFRTVEQSVSLSTRNILAIPIIFRDETLGTLEVINKSDEQDYTPEDQSNLEILASYAGTALQLHKLSTNADALSQEWDNLEKQKSDFIAITSHELRTPLGLILGHATFLQELVQDSFHQNQLDIVIQNAERLKTIIDRLSQADNFEAGTARIRWQRTELNQLLKNVGDSFQAEAQEREIDLEITLPTNSIYIHCDPAKLGVAIGNVVKNGLVFSDAGQTVQVGIHKLPGHVHITVVDSGIGIPVDDLQRIFERFYQVEAHLTRTRGGMGLGLSVAKAIVESHGGHIWVESVLGEGSAFTILLPTKIPSE